MRKLSLFDLVDRMDTIVRTAEDVAAEADELEEVTERRPEYWAPSNSRRVDLGGRMVPVSDKEWNRRIITQTKRLRREVTRFRKMLRKLPKVRNR